MFITLHRTKPTKPSFVLPILKHLVRHQTLRKNDMNK